MDLKEFKRIEKVENLEKNLSHQVIWHLLRRHLEIDSYVSTPEFDSYFWAKARPALSLSPKNFYRQCSPNVALYDIIKSISVLEGDNASARFNRFG